MDHDFCRLCLKTRYLKPIFVDITRCDRYSTVLRLTTGLKIEPNDGLPQKICKDCTKSVNQALKLRNCSYQAEKQFKRKGFKRKASSKKIKAEKQDGGIGGNTEKFAEIFDAELKECKPENLLDDIALPDFEIEVEFDRITEELKCEDFSFDSANIDEKSSESSKNTRQERRKEYLSLVEGVFDPKGPVKCRICKKMLSKWSTFVSHAQLHLGFKFVCEYCGKSFVSRTQLNRHCRSHHGMPRTLQCRLCDYLALDNAQLILHERRVHTGARPFTCSMCSASYHSRRCLLQHEESHATHTTIQCDLCPQLFKSRRHLARHKYATHTCKQFTYKCALCARAYRNRKYVAVHVRKAHGVTVKEAPVVKIKL